MYSALVEAHRKFEPATRPPRFIFEVDSRGKSAAPRWQLTFAVESGEAVEGWSQYWSEVSDGLGSARARHRVPHSIERRLVDAEPVRLQGMLGLRLATDRNCSPRWCVVRGPLLQFYDTEDDARRAESDGRVLTHRAGVHRGKGVDAQEATIHLEHAIVLVVPTEAGKDVWGIEIVSGSKSWRLQMKSHEEYDAWKTMLRSLAGGDPASARAGQGNGNAAAVAQADPMLDLVTVRAEAGQLQVGLNFARCFSERLGVEYFSVQGIRRPETVAAAAEPQLQLGMVLQSVNGVPFMLTLAECGGRGDVAFESLQKQLSQRPLTLTFVRTPDRLRNDIDAAEAMLESARQAAAAVTPQVSGNERRLVAGTGAISGSNGSWRSSRGEVADSLSAGNTHAPFAPDSKYGISSISTIGQPAGSQSPAVTISRTPIARAQALYGPWWSSMSKPEQQAAVAAAEQELALVEMKLVDPHHFGFHGNPWAVSPARNPATQQDSTTLPELPMPASLDLMPATREYLQGVADAKRMSISKSTTDLAGAPIGPSDRNAPVDGLAEFRQGVRDAQAQADALAMRSRHSQAEEWARTSHAAFGRGHGMGTAAALQLTASGAEYEL